MVNKYSIYALNKRNSDAIVYPSVTGKPVCVTRDDFSSEAEFLTFKAWSDANFHEEEKLDHRESNHTLAADELSEAALSVPAVEIVVERQQDKAEKRRKASELVIQLKDKLTETQFRRLWLYHVEGIDTYEIADMEGSSHQAISKSILAAEKKLKKFFPKP